MVFIMFSHVDWTLLSNNPSGPIAAFLSLDSDEPSSSVMDRNDVHIPCTFSRAEFAISLAFDPDMVYY